MLQESPQQKSVTLWFKFHLYNSIKHYANSPAESIEIQ